MGFFSKVFSPVGDILNGITGVSSTASDSYQYSKRLASQQQANNIALWNMQNAYNTPSAQIARMADAGIDINPMTYAVGNGSMSSTAQNISPATYHSPNYGSPGNPISMVMQVMSGIKDLERQDLQNKILQKDIDNYDHNHASPYKDVIQFIRDIFTGESPVTGTFGKVFDYFSTAPKPLPEPKLQNPDWVMKENKDRERYRRNKGFYDNFWQMY